MNPNIGAREMNSDSQTVLMQLWHRASDATNRTALASVTVELTPRQWVMLRARTFQNRIQCSVDSVKIIDVPVELPVGGRFGLFASGANRIKFDDVSARSNHDLDFRSLADIRRYTLLEQGQFFPGRRFFSLF